MLFFSGDQSVQGSRATLCRLQSKRHSPCVYVWKIAVNPRLGQVNIVVIGEAIYWGSTPQDSGSQEEDAKWSLHLSWGI